MGKFAQYMPQCEISKQCVCCLMKTRAQLTEFHVSPLSPVSRAKLRPKHDQICVPFISIREMIHANGPWTYATLSFSLRTNVAHSQTHEKKIGVSLHVRSKFAIEALGKTFGKGKANRTERVLWWVRAVVPTESRGDRRTIKSDAYASQTLEPKQISSQRESIAWRLPLQGDCGLLRSKPRCVTQNKSQKELQVWLYIYLVQRPSNQLGALLNIHQCRTTVWSVNVFVQLLLMTNFVSTNELNVTKSQNENACLLTPSLTESTVLWGIHAEVAFFGQRKWSSNVHPKTGDQPTILLICYKTQPYSCSCSSKKCPTTRCIQGIFNGVTHTCRLEWTPCLTIPGTRQNAFLPEVPTTTRLDLNPVSQDQTTTVLFFRRHCVVLKFQDQRMTK